MNLRTLLKVGWSPVMARTISNVRRAPPFPRPPHQDSYQLANQPYSITHSGLQASYVAAFWDLKSCPVPKDTSLTDFVHKVRETYFSQHTNYGFFCCLDSTKESERTLQELTDAKVSVIHYTEDREVYFNLYGRIWTYDMDASSLLTSLAIIISGNSGISSLLHATRYNFGFRTIWIYPNSLKRKSCFKAGTSFANDWISIEKFAKGIPNRNHEKEKKKKSTSISPTGKDQIC